MNRSSLLIHPAIRTIALTFGLVVIALCFNASQQQSAKNYDWMPQVYLASIGLSALSFSVAFWPERPSVFTYRTLFLSVAIFILGAAWIMAKGIGYFSVPGITMFFAAIGVAFAMFIPARYIR